MRSVTPLWTVALVTVLAAAAAGCETQPTSAAAAPPPEPHDAVENVVPETRPVDAVRPPSVTPRPASKRAAAPLATSGGTRPAIIDAPAPAPAVVEITVPEGTELSVELLNDLTSETATVETAVRGRLRHAVDVNGRTAIPAGATLSGAVTDVVRPGRVKGRASLSLQFTHVTVDGERSPLATSPVTVEGESDTRGDVTKIGVGAGVGAVVGGILGGGSGAAKGAAIGGAAGTGAVLATRGKDVVLAAGTTLSTTMAAAKTIEVSR